MLKTLSRAIRDLTREQHRTYNNVISDLEQLIDQPRLCLRHLSFVRIMLIETSLAGSHAIAEVSSEFRYIPHCY